MRVNVKRRTIERIEMDKAVAAPRENSGERRQAQATAKRKLASRQRRAQREQQELEHLLVEMDAKERAWEEERQEYRDELSKAAENELRLDRANKQGTLVKTVVTTAIAAATALGGAGLWLYGNMQRAAEEKVIERQRREQVQEALDDDRAAIKEVADDLGEYKRAQASVNDEQQKVNTVQLLRSQRTEIMLESLLRKEGRRPPKKMTKERRKAECEAGLLEPSECQD